MVARVDTREADAYERLPRAIELMGPAFDASTDMVAVYDDRQRIRYCNPVYSGTLGYEPGELLGCDRTSLIHPDDLRSLREHATTRYKRVRVLCADSSWLWVEGAMTQIPDAGDGHTYYYGICRPAADPDEPAGEPAPILGCPKCGTPRHMTAIRMKTWAWCVLVALALLAPPIPTDLDRLIHLAARLF